MALTAMISVLCSRSVILFSGCPLVVQVLTLYSYQNVTIQQILTLLLCQVPRHLVTVCARVVVVIVVCCLLVAVVSRLGLMWR